MVVVVVVETVVVVGGGGVKRGGPQTIVPFQLSDQKRNTSGNERPPLGELTARVHMPNTLPPVPGKPSRTDTPHANNRAD